MSSPDDKPGVKVKGERGRFVKRAAVAPPVDPRPPIQDAAPAPIQDVPAPAAPRPPLTSTSAGTGAISREPAPGVLAEVLRLVEEGDFQDQAFVQAGVPWDLAQRWLRLGDAASRLSNEDGRPLTWQGKLYRDLKAARARSTGTVVRKLRKQAEGGGRAALDYLGVIAGKVGGGAGVSKLGRDYEEEQVTGSKDAMGDEDLIRMLNQSIENARAAAKIRAGETPPTEQG